MKISILKKFEDFESIFKISVEHYVYHRYGVHMEISWQKRSWIDRLIGLHHPNTYLCNPDINTIFKADADKIIFTPAWSQYGRSSSFTGLLLRRIYLTLSTSNLLMGLFCPLQFSVKNDVFSDQTVCFAGGLSKIKIFNYTSFEVVNIHKGNFPSSFLVNEISFRCSNQRSYILPLIWFNDSSYCERLIEKADPLYYGYDELNDFYITKAFQYLQELFFSDYKEYKFEDYLEILLLQIFEFSPLFSDSLFSRIEQVYQELKIHYEGREVFVGRSHGDLSLGNMLIENDELMLIDWERTKHRAYGYDLFTYSFESRRNLTKFDEYISVFIDLDDDFIKQIFPRLAENLGGADLHMYFYLYLLEEIIYICEESVSFNITVPHTRLMSISNYFRCV